MFRFKENNIGILCRNAPSLLFHIPKQHETIFLQFPYLLEIAS